MVADFFTKPLQGKLFHYLKAIVMGHKPIDTITSQFFSLGQERVDRSDQVTSKEVSALTKLNRTNNFSKDSLGRAHLKSVPFADGENKRSYADVVQGREI
jgi:hypothetical protein